MKVKTGTLLGEENHGEKVLLDYTTCRKETDTVRAYFVDGRHGDKYFVDVPRAEVQPDDGADPFLEIN